MVDPEKLKVGDLVQGAGTGLLVKDRVYKVHEFRTDSDGFLMFSVSFRGKVIQAQDGPFWYGFPFQYNTKDKRFYK